VEFLPLIPIVASLHEIQNATYDGGSC